jgi:hypothetical protein
LLKQGQGLLKLRRVKTDLYLLYFCHQSSCRALSRGTLPGPIFEVLGL